MMLSLLRKLPWKVIGPILVVASLAFCVKLHIENNARADAYATVAKEATKQFEQLEKVRMSEKKITADSIASLRTQLAQSAPKQVEYIEKARKGGQQLRATLNPTQVQQLDSMEYRYRAAIASLQEDKADLESIIKLREDELADAEQQIAALKRENKLMQDIAHAESKRHSSTGWKIATAVSTAAALGFGIAAVAQ